MFSEVAPVAMMLEGSGLLRAWVESLGRPVGGNRHNVELALQAGHWLGSSVLRPAVTPARPG